MPSRSQRCGAIFRTVATGLLVSIALLAKATSAEAATSLLEVRSDRVPGTFLLVCDGSFRFSRAEDPDPLRLVLDLPDVRNGIRSERIPVQSDLVDRISVTRAGHRKQGTRVVFELSRPSPVSLIPDGNTLSVVLEPGDVPGVQPAGIAGNAATFTRAEGADPAPPGDYVIGAEDLLEITVFEQPELSQTVRVSGDGTIRMPLVGVIPVGGLTNQQAEAKLSALLGEKYLTDPQVSVFVKEAKSKRISVVGAVEKPGTVEMLGRRTLLEAISEAGGLTEEAGRNLHVLRPDPSGAAIRIDINLEDLMTGGDPELNVPIQPGDVINVPVDRIHHVYVDGAVNKPGELAYRSSRPLNLLQAIAAAGGLSERASQKGILVIRSGPGGVQQRIEVDLKAVRKGKKPNLTLERGDTVYVPETFF